MNTPYIDNISAGYIFAYDAKTGDVLWTHEKLVEVTRGTAERPTRPTKGECEQVRADAARVFRGREVAVILAPEGFAFGDHRRVRIDPSTHMIREIPDEVPSLADRLGMK